MAGISDYNKGSASDDYYKDFKSKYTKDWNFGDVFSGFGDSFSGLGDMLSEENTIGNYAKLGGLAMQLASLPTQYKSAKLKNEAMRTDIDTTNRDNANNAKRNIAFNAVAPGMSSGGVPGMSSGNVSAFANPDRLALA
jgi:hypothetical protein